MNKWLSNNVIDTYNGISFIPEKERSSDQATAWITPGY